MEAFPPPGKKYYSFKLRRRQNMPLLQQQKRGWTGCMIWEPMSGNGCHRSRSSTGDDGRFLVIWSTPDGSGLWSNQTKRYGGSVHRISMHWWKIALHHQYWTPCFKLFISTKASSSASEPLKWTTRIRLDRWTEAQDGHLPKNHSE